MSSGSSSEPASQFLLVGVDKDNKATFAPRANGIFTQTGKTIQRSTKGVITTSTQLIAFAVGEFLHLCSVSTGNFATVRFCDVASLIIEVTDTVLLNSAMDDDSFRVLTYMFSLTIADDEGTNIRDLQTILGTGSSTPNLVILPETEMEARGAMLFETLLSLGAFRGSSGGNGDLVPSVSERAAELVKFMDSGHRAGKKGLDDMKGSYFNWDARFSDNMESMLAITEDGDLTLQLSGLKPRTLQGPNVFQPGYMSVAAIACLIFIQKLELYCPPMALLIYGPSRAVSDFPRLKGRPVETAACIAGLILNQLTYHNEIPLPDDILDEFIVVAEGERKESGGIPKDFIDRNTTGHVKFDFLKSKRNVAIEFEREMVGRFTEDVKFSPEIGKDMIKYMQSLPLTANMRAYPERTAMAAFFTGMKLATAPGCEFITARVDSVAAEGGSGLLKADNPNLDDIPKVVAQCFDAAAYVQDVYLPTEPFSVANIREALEQLHKSKGTPVTQTASGTTAATEVRELGKQIGVDKQENDTLKVQIKNVVNQMSEMEKRASDSKQRFIDLQIRSTELENSLKEARARASESERRSADLQIRFTGLEYSLKAAEARALSVPVPAIASPVGNAVSALTTENLALHRDLTRQQAEIDNLSKQNDDLRQRILAPVVSGRGSDRLIRAIKTHPDPGIRVEIGPSGDFVFVEDTAVFEKAISELGVSKTLKAVFGRCNSIFKVPGARKFLAESPVIAKNLKSKGDVLAFAEALDRCDQESASADVE